MLWLQLNGHAIATYCHVTSILAVFCLRHWRILAKLDSGLLQLYRTMAYWSNSKSLLSIRPVWQDLINLWYQVWSSIPLRETGSDKKKQKAQLLLTNRELLVCKVIEVCQDFLSEYVDEKFTYICYRRLIRHQWIHYGSKNCVIYNSYNIA